jgi:hypothetical protein
MLGCLDEARWSVLQTRRTAESGDFQGDTCNICLIWHEAHGESPIVCVKLRRTALTYHLWLQRSTTRGQKRIELTQVQMDTGMTLTTTGQLVKLVKLSAAERAPRHFVQSRVWVHYARVTWSRWTSVEDRFTGMCEFGLLYHAHIWAAGCALGAAHWCAGHVFMSAFGEALHPSAPVYRAWNTALLCMMTYAVVAAPMRAAFHVHAAVLDWLALIIQVTLLIDIAATFFVCVDHGKTMDHLEQRPLRIAEHYLTTWLLYDVVTTLPWKALLPFIIGKTWITETALVADSLDIIKILRTVPILRRKQYKVIGLTMQHKQRATITFVGMVLVRNQQFVLPCPCTFGIGTAPDSECADRLWVLR